jgi:hypothetical protein
MTGWGIDMPKHSVDEFLEKQRFAIHPGQVWYSPKKGPWSGGNDLHSLFVICSYDWEEGQDEDDGYWKTVQFYWCGSPQFNWMGGKVHLFQEAEIRRLTYVGGLEDLRYFPDYYNKIPFWQRVKNFLVAQTLRFKLCNPGADGRCGKQP